MSDDSFACGLASKGEVKLSDEQVDLLNQDPGVVAARRAFFQAKTVEAHKQYLEVFRARLNWVVANPPAPKEKASKRIAGFATRA
jgi:hypothetical protein